LRVIEEGGGFGGSNDSSILMRARGGGERKKQVRSLAAAPRGPRPRPEFFPAGGLAIGEAFVPYNLCVLYSRRFLLPKNSLRNWDIKRAEQGEHRPQGKRFCVSWPNFHFPNRQVIRSGPSWGHKAGQRAGRELSWCRCGHGNPNPAMHALHGGQIMTTKKPRQSKRRTTTSKLRPAGCFRSCPRMILHTLGRPKGFKPYWSAGCGTELTGHVFVVAGTFSATIAHSFS